MQSLVLWLKDYSHSRFVFQSTLHHKNHTLFEVAGSGVQQKGCQKYHSSPAAILTQECMCARGG